MSVRGLFKKYRMTLRIVFAVIGIIVGLSACIAFAVKFNNLHAASWAGVSAIFASLTFYLHVSVKRDVQRQGLQSPSFGTLMILGALGLLSGLASFIAYIVVGQARHEKGVDAKGHYVVTVWSFMTFKWGLLLLLYARKYRKMYQDANQTLETSGIINSA